MDFAAERRFFRGLTTLHTEDPTAIRTEVLRTLHDRAEGDVSLWFALSPGVDRPRISDWTLVGDRLLDGAMRTLSERPDLWPANVVRSFVAPPLAERHRFVTLQEVITPKALEASPMYANIWNPYGVTDQARLLVVHGGRFIGHVGAYRRGGTFKAITTRRLSVGAPAIVNALTAADTLERQQMPDAAFVMARPDGTVEHASRGATAWLSEAGFREQLASYIRETDASREVERSALLRGAALRVIRLDGASVRYLASMTPAPRLAIDPLAELPPMQRRIAEAAAAGATIDEIARDLGRSRNTIKTQLRSIYSRLGIASRVELARFMAVDR